MTEPPVITPSGERLYRRVSPLYTGDEETGWFGMHYSDALMAMLQGLDQIVLDTATHPGWCTLLDPAVCPKPWLPWCGQIYGVTLPPNADEAEDRATIGELPPQKRGGVAAMIAAATPTLTGLKEIHIEEQAEGHAYRLIVTTAPAETPSEQATLNALLSQKAGGLKLIYIVTASPLWDEATLDWNEVAAGVTWASVKAGQV
jgi:hypothetical protein